VTVRLHVNGEVVQLEAACTIGDVVALVTGEQDPRGVAVAVDRCVIPRSEWWTTPARAGALVEVVTAAAGG
jgi:sulfur carrier protein